MKISFYSIYYKQPLSYLHKNNLQFHWKIMAKIPQSEYLSTNNLSCVFNNTSATYKFYWFKSLLQMRNEEGAVRMSVWDLVIRMVANAWYTIHYFRLSPKGPYLNSFLNVDIKNNYKYLF